MVSLILLSLAVTIDQAKTINPIVAPIKFFFSGDPVIAISIDGKEPQEFGLTMTTRHSIVVKGDDAGSAKQLSINGKPFATANLESAGASVHPVLNALGLGVLKSMAIGVDYAKNEITFWPGGKLTPEAAKAWILKAPKWGGESKVWTTPIKRRAEVAPVVTLTIGVKKAEMLLRIGQQGTSFARGEDPTTGIGVEYGPGGNHALMSRVGVGSVSVPWMLYFKGVSYDPRKEIDPSIVGLFTVDNLLARRVILDLPGDAMYAEQLTSDEQISMFLSEWFQMPIDVQGDKMVLREMPSTKFYPQLTPIYESEILEIMGQPAKQLLDASRDITDAHTTYLKQLFERVWQGYRVKFKRTSGEVVEATFSPPKAG